MSHQVKALAGVEPQNQFLCLEILFFFTQEGISTSTLPELLRVNRALKACTFLIFAQYCTCDRTASSIRYESPHSHTVLFVDKYLWRKNLRYKPLHGISYHSSGEPPVWSTV